VLSTWTAFSLGSALITIDTCFISVTIRHLFVDVCLKMLTQRHFPFRIKRWIIFCTLLVNPLSESLVIHYFRDKCSLIKRKVRIVWHISTAAFLPSTFRIIISRLKVALDNYYPRFEEKYREIRNENKKEPVFKIFCEFRSTQNFSNIPSTQGTFAKRRNTFLAFIKFIQILINRCYTFVRDRKNFVLNPTKTIEIKNKKLQCLINQCVRFRRLYINYGHIANCGLRLVVPSPMYLNTNSSNVKRLYTNQRITYK